MNKIVTILSLLCFVIFIIPTNLLAQKERNVWYFGQNAGIDFKYGAPVAILNGKINKIEGYSSVCDSMGKLLFYTDGIFVWDRMHNVMTNGSGLAGGPSSTQAALIVQQPGNDSLYYIFTTADGNAPDGFQYSVVNMNLRGGFGDVTASKNIPVLTPVCEKVVAVRHQNGRDYWIIVHLYNSNKFYSYLLTSNGFDTTPIISNGGVVVFWGVGYMKANINGNRIAVANSNMDNVELFYFDNTTGNLLYDFSIGNFSSEEGAGAYGAEFSPDGNLFYLSEFGGNRNILQFDLSAGTSTDIISSKTIIGNTRQRGGAMQLGPDGKIYVARNSKDSLGVIYYPNRYGKTCNYVENGVSLFGEICELGFPNFPNDFIINPIFLEQNVCFGDSTSFTITNTDSIDAVSWNFGDINSGIQNESTSFSPVHVFTDTGAYPVTLITVKDGVSDTVTRSVRISSVPFPLLGKDTTLCIGDTLQLEASMYSEADYVWQDGSKSTTLEIDRAGTYYLHIDLYNCISSDTVVVDSRDCPSYLDLPNIITPNGDQINDLFVPIRRHKVSSINTAIYDRWGNKVFQTDAIDIGWDGHDCPDGTYFYKIEYYGVDAELHTRKGYVHILR